jgi:hypothetical protein
MMLLLQEDQAGDPVVVLHLYTRLFQLLLVVLEQLVKVIMVVPLLRGESLTPEEAEVVLAQ